MTAVLGCIADDFTGGTDLAETLSRNGMRTIQLLGVPDTALASEAAAQADALVVALKIRTVPVEEAVSQALAALEALRAAGCRQFFWKYCSTFDSTPKGNIGPVAEALLQALGGDRSTRPGNGSRSPGSSRKGYRAVCLPERHRRPAGRGEGRSLCQRCAGRRHCH